MLLIIREAILNTKSMSYIRGKKISKNSKGRKPPEEAFRKIGTALTSKLDEGDTLKAIVAQIKTLLQPADVMLFIKKGNNEEFYLSPRVGKKNTKFSHHIREGIVGWVLKEGKPVYVEDAIEHPRYSTDVDLKVTKESPALLCAPLISRGTIHGAIEIGGKSFSKEEIEILLTIADFSTVAIENSKHVAKIKELTITDDLTGLYNARHLSRVLEMEIRRAQRYEEEFAVIFIDLDKFKNVNDKYGHLVGSRVLKETGLLIGEALRKDIDSAFRYGGDEFVVVLPKTDSKGAEVVARRIQRVIKHRAFMSDEGERFHLTASFGIAIYPKDATSKEDIIKLADESMYEVKRKGRDGIAFKGKPIKH